MRVWGIRNCLVVQRIGRYLVYLVHVEHLGEMGWRPRGASSERCRIDAVRPMHANS